MLNSYPNKHLGWRRILAILIGLLMMNVSLVSRASAASSLTLDIDPESYVCTQPTFEDFEDLAHMTSLDDQTRQGLHYSRGGLRVADRQYSDPNFAMRGSRALSAFIGETRIDFVYGPASTFSLLLSMNPWVLDYPGKPVILEAYAADGTLLDTVSHDQPNIGTGTMLEFKITRSTAEIAYIEIHGEERSQFIDAICTNAPNAPAPAATVMFHQPLDPSTSAGIVANKAKAGRTIPVKVEIALDGVEQDGSNLATPPAIAVSEIACSGQATDPVESYVDGGTTTNGTAFRWSADAPGFWIYNLNTQAWGMTVGTCYRLDVYLDNTQVTTDLTQWAIVEITK